MSMVNPANSANAGNLAGSGIAVLVVEDNAVLLKVAVTNLRRLGVEVDTAKNGREAVVRFLAKEYSLVLMDVMMPEMDGHEATRRIRAVERQTGRRVPIIAVTASDSKDRCLMSGMDDYIDKPADYQRILEKWLPDFQISKRTSA